MRPTTYSRQRDWFAISEEEARPLYYEIGESTLLVPGAKRPDANGNKTGQVLVHRTHLPLLDVAQPMARVSDWDVRDRRTETLGFRCRTTQHEALDYIEPRRGVLVGDDMRLGKTLTAIMAHDPARGPLVIVGPLSTRGVWLGWLRRVFPGVEISVLVGRKFDPVKLKAPIIWAHYDIIPYWQAVFPIGTLVLDEAHALIKRGTRRSNAVAILASRAEKMIAATGTPIWNVPANLWNLVSMLAPSAWGSYYEFGWRYGAPEQNGYGTRFTGISNEDELRARLAEVMIRRQWKDAVDEVPSISRNVLVAEVDDVTRRRLDILAGQLKSDRSNTAANLAIYREHVAKIKLKVVIEEARRARERGEPIVVWSWHVGMAKQIAEQLGTPFVLHGDVPATQRESRIEAWKREPAMPLVANLAVAQAGLDFSHSRLALFAELDYIPAVIAQGEMRTFDPTRGMNVTFVVANHFVDQKLVKALIAKLGSSSPLGLDAATDAIDALREAIEGPRVEPDMDRFLDDILASAMG